MPAVMAGKRFLRKLNAAAARTTTGPETSLLKWLKWRAFPHSYRHAVREFVSTLQGVDESVLWNLDKDQMASVKTLIEEVIENIEGYVRRRYSRKPSAEAQRLVKQIYALRYAAEGIALGYSADPERRPSIMWKTGMPKSIRDTPRS